MNSPSSFAPAPGQKVYFGRAHGEQTLGEVIKVNRASIKIKQLESRGTMKDHKVGTVWTVARSLVSPAPEGAKPELVSFPSNQPTNCGAREAAFCKFHPGVCDVCRAVSTAKAKRPEPVIMGAIQRAYINLSPENLSCDGELPQAQVRSRERALKSELRKLFLELGREVSEDEAYRAGNRT